MFSIARDELHGLPHHHKRVKFANASQKLFPHGPDSSGINKNNCRSKVTCYVPSRRTKPKSNAGLTIQCSARWTIKRGRFHHADTRTLHADAVFNKLQAVGGAQEAGNPSIVAKGTYKGYDTDHGTVPRYRCEAPNQRSHIAHALLETKLLQMVVTVGLLRRMAPLD
jgi:hypothetical protein